MVMLCYVGFTRSLRHISVLGVQWSGPNSSRCLASLVSEWHSTEIYNVSKCIIQHRCVLALASCCIIGQLKTIESHYIFHK